MHSVDRKGGDGGTMLFLFGRVHGVGMVPHHHHHNQHTHAHSAKGVTCDEFDHKICMPTPFLSFDVRQMTVPAHTNTHMSLLFN